MKWIRAVTREELIGRLKESWCIVAVYTKDDRLFETSICNPQRQRAIEYFVDKLISQGRKVATLSIPDPECPKLPGEK